MARKAERSGWVSFVPEAFEQRSGFQAGTDENPITIEIHALSVTEQRIAKKDNAVVLKKNGRIDVPNADQHDRELFVANVRKVENYTLVAKDADAAAELSKLLRSDVKAGDEIVIDTGERLWLIGEPEIVDEVRAAIQSASTLEEGRRDSLRSQSAGSLPATHR